MGSILSDGVRGDFVDVAKARERKEREERDRLASQSTESYKSRDWSKKSGTEFLDLEAALAETEREVVRGRGERFDSSGG